ncbi:MAG: hypothetical protein AB7Q45_16975 [Planctomycetaceae bacterium]
MNSRVEGIRFCVTTLLLALPVTGQAEETGIQRGQRIGILSGDELPMQAQLAREDFCAFLQRALGVTVHRRSGSTPLSEIDEPVCVLLGTRTENAAIAGLQEQGFDVLCDGLGEEGCRIKTGTVGGKLIVVLTGQTLTGASHAVYSLLENELGVGFFIDGNRVPELERVELAGLDRTETPAVPLRGLFYHHTWKHPHANCWRLWDFDGWKNAIDWMRRKRFNFMPMIHDDGGYMWGDAIFQAFPEIPQNEHTLKHFVVDPVWRRELNQQIFAYARGSGINIAYNLFYSQMPEFFADYHPELRYHELNMQNVGIDADQPQCREIMKRYWQAILDTYGIDDSHVYLVCSYKHERLGQGMPNKNGPTNDAWKIIQELDPQATMYIETWCWKYRDEDEKTRKTLDENPILEWHDFDRGVPKEVGVAEWDVRRMHPEGFPRGFGDRPFIQLTHSNMEGWWPPNTHRNHPQWLVEYFGEAIDTGADGVLFFHIQADTNEIVADLASKIGWEGRPDVDRFYRDYVRRRFGAESIDALAESLSLLCDAVDYGANRQTSPFPEMMHPLVPPGFDGSAEEQLSHFEEDGAARTLWIENHLAVFRDRGKLAAQAVLLARSVAPRLQNEPFIREYLWELDYVAARYEGIENMFSAHLLAEADPEQAARHFDRAVEAFFTVKELFRDKPEIRMSELRKLEPDVPYTSAFLQDWETRGYWMPRVLSFHVVWERFDHFEQLIRNLRPPGLPSGE